MSGVPWEARPSSDPVSYRNTRSTPSTRSCSSCCGGARSSIACSVRSSTASSELRLPPQECRCLPTSTSLSLPRALDGGTPAALPRCLWLLPQRADPGNVLLEFIEIIKPWYVWISVGFCTGWPVTPILPSCGARTGFGI